LAVGRVLDEREIVLKPLGELLSRSALASGYEVETAADGKEGLRKLQSGNFESVVTYIEFDHWGMLPRLVMPCRRPAEPATLRLV